MCRGAGAGVTVVQLQTGPDTMKAVDSARASLQLLRDATHEILAAFAANTVLS